LVKVTCNTGESSEACDLFSDRVALDRLAAIDAAYSLYLILLSTSACGAVCRRYFETGFNRQRRPTYGVRAASVDRTQVESGRLWRLPVVCCLTRILHGRPSCSRTDSERSQPCVWHGIRVTSRAPLPQHPPFARATTTRALAMILWDPRSDDQCT